MSISELSIRKPVFAWMLMAALIFFGAISARELGISQMPDVDFPVLNVAVTWEGAAPEVMEAEIADKMEQAVISSEGLRDITSNIRQGQVNMTLEFDLDRDVDAALQEVQSAITRLKLPPEVDPPTISKSNPDDSPILWLGVQSNRPLRDLIEYVDLHLKDQFQIIPGVGEIILGGIVERNLRVWVDHKKLTAHELTMLDVVQSVSSSHLEAAAGFLENDQQELNLRTMAEGSTPEEVASIPITSRGGKPIYQSSVRLGDVARIEDGLADIRRIARVFGKQGVGLGIKKQRGANTVQVGRLVKTRMEELSKTLPPDMSMVVNFDSTKFIEDSVAETEFTLVLSAIVTALVCWFFLGSWSPTFNILLSIPTSIIGSFIVIHFMGFTLNFFTLLGLALAIGIVVDDAIMVLENIYRHLEMKKSPLQASIDGSREITFAAVAASLAVVAIFLPVAFMKGVIGKFFFQFGVTMTAAVMLSLLEAVTLTPMRCSQLLSESTNPGAVVRAINSFFMGLANAYRSGLAVCLNARWLVILFSLALFGGSIVLMQSLRREFIPPQDQSMFMMRLQSPIGSSILSTDEIVKKAEQIITTLPEIRRVYTSVGGFGGGEVNTAMMFLSLVPPDERKASQADMMNLVRTQLTKIPNLRANAQDLSMRGFTAQRGFPVEFNIRGSDWSVLSSKAKEIEAALVVQGLITDVDDDYRVGQPEVRVRPRRDIAAQMGVNIEDISRTVQAAIGGVRVGKFTKNGRRYDVRIRLERDQRISTDQIQNLLVRNAYGELIKLGDVVSIETVPTLQTITRRTRERSISVTANLAPGASQAVVLDAAEQLGRDLLPEGYRLFLGGGARTFKESADSLLFVFWLGIVISYMILASQFNSFIHPITVLVSLPFSLTGAIAALYLGDLSLNLYSMIGIILLMGIVKKNAILLVEFTNQLREDGSRTVRQALLEACPIRLRPILMTSAATIAAAVPPALALGPGAESRIPMAVTIIGGVLVSTLFTLFVVPCVYLLFSRVEGSKSVH